MNVMKLIILINILMNYLLFRIKLLEEEEKNYEHQHQTEVEQLKRSLNEKEDNINELMSTLNSFHVKIFQLLF